MQVHWVILISHLSILLKICLVHAFLYYHLHSLYKITCKRMMINKNQSDQIGWFFLKNNWIEKLIIQTLLAYWCQFQSSNIYLQNNNYKKKTKQKTPWNVIVSRLRSNEFINNNFIIPYGLYTFPQNYTNHQKKIIVHLYHYHDISYRYFRAAEFYKQKHAIFLIQKPIANFQWHQR